MGARIFILLLSTIGIVMCCCGPAAELMPVYVEKTPIEIIAGYSLGKPSGGGLEFYGKQRMCFDDHKSTCYPPIVEQSVVKIGWNDDFILVERHPRDTYILATPDATNPSWFIIEVSSNTIHSDLSYEKYTELIQTLNIPDIKMQNAVDVYKNK
jgi:hypothetical protein